MRLLVCLALCLAVSPAWAKKSGKKARAGARPAKAATAVSPKKEITLYQRLGGASALTAIVDQFVANCAGDPRVASFFTSTAADAARMTRFKKNLTDQLCEATGGPCKYSGKDMKNAHDTMKISNEQFDAVSEDLTAALTQFRVGTREQAEVMKFVSSLRPKIVTVNS
ncbi:MAG: group 1 truncated hemoglobin [Deltaproteobacteria bacterium]|nr:group 1 truncated hemoglobin [Deltaproteobacteria bacterium]MBI3294642.1 group 1 truncated hemoglobin [Deltaproteobacteria bacterium]